jgi:hypothetical protein
MRNASPDRIVSLVSFVVLQASFVVFARRLPALHDSPQLCSFGWRIPTSFHLEWLNYGSKE